MKYQLIQTRGGEVLCKGVFERIGDAGSFLVHTVAGEVRIDFACKTHGDAVARLFEILVDTKHGVLKNLSEIDAIGHRVVHGGEVFSTSALANEKSLREVERLSALAPLHNPANIVGVRECIKRLDGVPNVMVFDTAFHSTMPKKAFLYALPLDDYKTHKIRRYGFHGTSHNYVARRAAEMAGKDIKKLKIITCHIGNGCSVCAIDGGRSVETSMGLTPLEGLVMGSRSGDIDPAVVEMLCKIHNLSVGECINYLNKKCGLVGLSGMSDMRDLMQTRGVDENVKTAMDCFMHRIVKYIGAYTAVMGGVDIVVWTGGIGNNDYEVRRDVMSHFAYLGATVDPNKNEPLNGLPGGRNLTRDISATGARVKTMVICTNEELEIACETEKVVGGE